MAKRTHKIVLTSSVKTCYRLTVQEFWN